MRTRTLTLPALLIIAIIALLAACAKNMIPAAHPESLAAGQQSDCSECHDDELKGTIKSSNAFKHSPSFISRHRLYAGSNDRLCVTCHKGSFCNDCHTNQVNIKPSIKSSDRPEREKAHRGDFLSLHKIQGNLYPAGCYRCHEKDFNERCVSCHRDGGMKK